MAVILLFALLIAAFVFLLLQWRKSALVFLGTALMWSLLAGNGIVPKVLLGPLETDQQKIEPVWKDRNVIVLLAAGSYQWKEGNGLHTHPMGKARVLEAARLYTSCKKSGRHCIVLPSGGDVKKLGISEAQIMKSELVEIGVSPEDVLLEEKSVNTYENAGFSAPLIASGKFDQVYVVTNGFHMKRSLVLFEHFKINAVGAPSDNLNFRLSFLPIGSNFYWTDLALHEYAGLLKFYLWELMGLSY